MKDALEIDWKDPRFWCYRVTSGMRLAVQVMDGHRAAMEAAARAGVLDFEPGDGSRMDPSELFGRYKETLDNMLRDMLAEYRIEEGDLVEEFSSGPPSSTCDVPDGPCLRLSNWDHADQWMPDGLAETACEEVLEWLGDYLAAAELSVAAFARIKEHLEDPVGNIPEVAGKLPRMSGAGKHAYERAFAVLTGFLVKCHKDVPLPEVRGNYDPLLTLLPAELADALGQQADVICSDAGGERKRAAMRRFAEIGDFASTCYIPGYRSGYHLLDSGQCTALMRAFAAGVNAEDLLAEYPFARALRCGPRKWHPCDEGTVPNMPVEAMFNMTIGTYAVGNAFRLDFLLQRMERRPDMT